MLRGVAQMLAQRLSLGNLGFGGGGSWRAAAGRQRMPLRASGRGASVGAAALLFATLQEEDAVLLEVVIQALLRPG